RSKETQQSLRLLTAIPDANKFSDAAGNASATVLEQVGRGAFKAARLNKDGHLIKGYYDLPKPAPQSALPVIIAFIKRPTSIPLLLSTLTFFFPAREHKHTSKRKRRRKTNP